mgnify:CR=1 FL=1
MKIIIIGSGVIGVTTAYELLKSGYEVALFDRQPSPACETSYGNAGLIAPGHSYSWTPPKIPGQIFKSIFKKNKHFKFKLQWDINMWLWGMQFVFQCTSSKMKQNTLRKYKLSNYSQKCFHNIINENNFNFYENKKGLIYIFRNSESFEQGKKKLQLFNSSIDGFKLLDYDDLIKLEPSLKYVKDGVFGGIYCQSDESGSCSDFTIQLAEKCKKMGAEFHYNTNVNNFSLINNNIVNIQTNKGNFYSDKYIIACASFSSLLAKKLGEYIPIYPVKGYSITVPIVNKKNAPQHSGIDEDNLLAFSLMGNRIRFTSMAEISDYNTEYRLEDFSQIIDYSASLFPNICDYSNAEYWCGLRPMTPTGSPIIGRNKINNLYYNTGHGHLGWTMSAGSAKIIKDIIMGNKPDIEMSGMFLA